MPDGTYASTVRNNEVGKTVTIDISEICDVVLRNGAIAVFACGRRCRDVKWEVCGLGRLTSV
jgi:hypothetical protein